MLLSIGSQTRPALPWVVYAYDIACPKRARMARAVLAPHAGPRQYSVFECRLSNSWARDLLAEVAAGLDAQADHLALWWPRDGQRVGVGAGRRWLAREGVNGNEQRVDAARCAALLAGAGTFVVSYDITCPRRAAGIHARVAGGGVMLQRSVYQWRCPVAVMVRLLEGCAARLEAGDRFWVHPLRRSGDLWRVGEASTSLLPIATHHWPHHGV